MVILCHILRPLEHKARIMAEPENVQHDHIPEINDRPKQEAGSKGSPKAHGAVHVPQEQAEDENEQKTSAELGGQLVLLGGELVFVLAQRLDAFLNSGGIIVQRLDGIAGQKGHHQGEDGTQYDAFQCKDHFCFLSFSRRFDAVLYCLEILLRPQTDAARGTGHAVPSLHAAEGGADSGRKGGTGRRGSGCVPRSRISSWTVYTITGRKKNKNDQIIPKKREPIPT